MRQIVMPQAGKSGGALTVRKWLKGVGQGVEKGEIIAQVESADGLIELEAAEAGVMVKILVGDGKTAAAGSLIAQVDAGSGSASRQGVPTPKSDKATRAATTSAGVVPLLMPQAGNSMEEGTIVKWMVKEGDRITKGQVIYEIETDKANMEVEAAESGRLAKIVAFEGMTIPVKQPVAYLAESDADVAAFGAGFERPVAEKPAAAVPEKKMPEQAVAEAIPVLMPQAGNSMEEGTIVKWMVKEGDRITKGQVIFEIETDKANMEVEATDAGRLAKIVAAEGATVAVKQPVAYLSEGEVNVAETEAKKAEPQKAEEAMKENAPSVPFAPSVAIASSGILKASPAAKKLAREQGIDLSAVAGSGPGGRILSTDFAGARPSAPKVASAAPAAAPAQAPVTPPTLPVAQVARKKMSKMRKAIAINLQVSKQTVPHFYLRGTINADAMMAFYRGEKAKYPCSVNDVVTLACAKAITEFPAFRSKIEGDEMVEYPGVNIGVAVGVEDGLTVPVILNAHTMNLQQIAANTKRVVENARAGKLEGYGQGNFTITNLGMFGVEEFAAIVNPPEPGILAVGAVREAVVVQDGAVVPGKVMTMTLSCDHRLVDGLLAAKFMARLKELLENPTVLA
jgi:pyruvate dehydrogenase E2 component (dihydrolipoamide acetyltransferase)